MHFQKQRARAKKKSRKEKNEWEIRAAFLILKSFILLRCAAAISWFEQCLCSSVLILVLRMRRARMHQFNRMIQKINNYNIRHWLTTTAIGSQENYKSLERITTKTTTATTHNTQCQANMKWIQFNSIRFKGSKYSHAHSYTYQTIKSVDFDLFSHFVHSSSIFEHRNIKKEKHFGNQKMGESIANPNDQCTKIKMNHFDVLCSHLHDVINETCQSTKMSGLYETDHFHPIG